MGSDHQSVKSGAGNVSCKSYYYYYFYCPR